MNEQIKTLEYLKRNKPSAKQSGLIVNIGKSILKEPEPKEGEEELITEESEIQEKKEEKKEIKQHFKDYRKISKIDMSVILDRLKDKKPFKVGVLHSLKDLSKEQPVPIPIGESGIKGTKKTVVIKEPINLELKEIEDEKEEIIDIPVKSKIISEDLLDEGERELEAKVEPEVENLDDLKEMIKKAEEKNIEVEIIDEDKPIKELSKKDIDKKELEVVKKITKAKNPRKPKLRILDDIKLDLTTTEIKEKLPEMPEPKMLEKVTMKAPTYYMNNRKLYVQKIAEMLKL
jgi:hypothetical protein